MANPAINRSGNLQPTMLPSALTQTVKLANQVRQGVDKTVLDIKPIGTNLVGQTQYSYTVQRPGGTNTASPFTPKNSTAMGYIANAIQRGLIIRK